MSSFKLRYYRFNTLVAIDYVTKSKDLVIVDFNNPNLYANTWPIICIVSNYILNNPLYIKNIWASFLIAVAEFFIHTNNPNIDALDKIFVPGNKKLLAPMKLDSHDCWKLSNGKWICISPNSKSIIENIGNLCQYCGVSLENVVIICFKDNLDFTNKNNTAKNPFIINSSLAEKVRETMRKRFPNGIRIHSVIDLSRFRRFIAEDFGNNLEINDEQLILAILFCGTYFEEKVYVVEDEIESQIRNVIESAVSDGVEIIYYNSLFSRHEKWLYNGGVVSEKLLKNILIKLYPNYVHKDNYFLINMKEKTTEVLKITRELLRVWGDDVVLNYDKFSERLPYIPIEKIKQVLALDDSFIWDSVETYTHINKFDINDEEKAAVAEYVKEAYLENGYAILNTIPLFEIPERNYELSLTGIYNAIFKICLSDKYNKSGKIITLKGDSFDILTKMKEYCRKLDKCTLKDLLNYEQKLTGYYRHSTALEVGHSTMVRIDKDNFVADKFVFFDVVGIDRAIEWFVKDDYSPIKGIDIFATFPYCGHQWNLFLLESYCRRFSEKFRFETIGFNSKNVGVVVRKNCLLSYTQIMADAVAKSETLLEKDAVEKFLYDSGFINRSSYANTLELIEIAKTIRERRN